MKVSRNVSRRQEARKDYLEGLHERVEITKKIETWMKKQAERDEELAGLICDLYAAGESKNNIKLLTGLTQKELASILPGKDDAARPESDDEDHDESSSEEEIASSTSADSEDAQDGDTLAGGHY
ncbi:hypothetical protein L1O03_02935 [Corynebacterium uropygiale]|uniref:Uncharacterized protein n=1 Tax=Corynebacterium uropygiale TaxID=1775911 RepID=A0A9X1QQX9_9CORY|nr:hypothetical protein [Corynebacterium uropygiale]MCF4006133.1 hypothetical protein [Corynebacterium uropygiale]